MVVGTAIIEFVFPPPGVQLKLTAGLMLFTLAVSVTELFKQITVLFGVTLTVGFG